MSRKEIRTHIEDTGKVFERFGLTPMQGRILSYLSNAEQPEATFADLVTFFNASKSSISTSINYLLSAKMIDYKTYASERKKHFYLTENFFRVYFLQVVNNVRDMKELCYKTISMRTTEFPDVSEKILKWIEDANLFEKNMSDTVGEISRK